MGASTWHGLVGMPGYAAGTAGTVTVPAGCVVLSIVAHATAAAATLSLFGGAAMPVVAGAAPTKLDFAHTLYISNSASGNTIVFTNTDSYFVHWVREGNAV